MEQLGYVGDPTPFLATTTQFVPVVAACGDAEQRSRFLGAVAGEGQAGTLALAGPNGRWDPHAPPVEARRTAGGWAAARHAPSFVLDGDRVAELAVLGPHRRGACRSSSCPRTPSELARTARRSTGRSTSPR